MCSLFSIYLVASLHNRTFTWFRICTFVWLRLILFGPFSPFLFLFCMVLLVTLRCFFWIFYLLEMLMANLCSLFNCPISWTVLTKWERKNQIYTSKVQFVDSVGLNFFLHTRPTVGSSYSNTNQSDACGTTFQYKVHWESKRFKCSAEFKSFTLFAYILKLIYAVPQF